MCILQEKSLKGRGAPLFSETSCFLLAGMQMGWMELEESSWIKRWKFKG